MNKTMFVFIASPFLWFLSPWAATAQDVAQSDQITQDQQSIQADGSTEWSIS